MTYSFSFIDLFCGVGGIRLGMEQAGFHCVMSSDIDPACRRVYRRNFGDTPLGDIRTIEASAVPDHDVLCAGFPCQPFSISGKKQGFADTRGTLFFEICRIARKKRPPVILLENVKHLLYHDKGRTLGVILGSLEELGYKVSYRVLNASDFGVPQHRERVLFVASRIGLFDFERVQTRPRCRLTDFLDRDGNFTYLPPEEYVLLDDMREQESGLLFAGYRKGNIRQKGVRPETLHLSRVHKQPNRIYSVNGVHPSLMSQETSGRYWIRTEDDRVRKLTLDECWRLMGFPDTFERSGLAGEQYRQLGNSVCVPMIATVAKEIYKGLKRGRFLYG